jgi:predicted dehydrogenase
MIRIGLLSTAAINYNVVIMPAQKFPNVKVTAVGSRDLERGRKFAEKYRLEKYYGSYQALVDDPDLDVIYISTPNAFHVEWVIKALEAGKHVLCEKPISHTYQDALKIIALAKEKNLLVMDALHYLYHPTTKSTIERIKEGALGEILGVHVQLGYPKPPEGDIRYKPWVLGGSFMHMACYCGHLLHWLIETPTHINRLCSEFHPNGADTLTWGWLSAEGYDYDFTFRGSLRERTLNSRVTVIASKGSITIYELFNPSVIKPNSIEHDLLRIHATKGEWPNPPYGRTSYDFQFETFINCLMKGDFTPHVDPRSSYFVESGRTLIYGPEIPQDPFNVSS